MFISRIAIGNDIENFQNPTHMFSYNWMNNQPLHLVSILFSCAEILSGRIIFSGCPKSFIGCRMGQCEWMALMWSACETTPSIHNASMTWTVVGFGQKEEKSRSPKMKLVGDPIISVAENTQQRLHLLLRPTYMARCDSQASCHGLWPKLMINPPLFHHLRYTCLIRLLMLIRHLCLSGMW